MSEKNSPNLSINVKINTPLAATSTAELTPPTVSRSQQTQTQQQQRCPLYKPIPVVVSSITLGPGPNPPMYTSASPGPSVARTPSEVVSLDHNYSLLPQTSEDALLKPITKPIEVLIQEENIKVEKVLKIEKPEKTIKPIPIIKKEVEKPLENVLVKPTTYIFHQPPEPLPKKVSCASNSAIFLSNLKSSVFPVSPSMSKLEHLLKSPSRSPNPRRSPSSFLSPSLNYHRSKNISGLSSPSSSHVVVPEKVNDSDTDDEIDIECVDQEPTLQYDPSKSRNLMNECEKYVHFLRQTEVPEDWENHIVKTGWSEAQLNIFNGVIEALHSERLSRLVNEKRVGEPVLRRISIDSTAERVRRVITRHYWNSQLTQWLHCVLVDHLDKEYLSAYLDVLQTLRAKIPDLIDKMVIISTGAASEPLPVNPLIYNPESELSDPAAPNLNSIKETLQKNINAEAVNLVLKRKWDPFNSVIQQSRTKKLPNSPIFVMLSLSPRKNHHATHRRTKNFTSLLAGRGKVVSVSLSINDNIPRLVLHIKKLFKVATEKVRDLKRQFPERPLFLVGWSSGAFLASRISMVEPVAGVIALGFRLRSPYRGRGTWIQLLDMKCPVLFLIGELSTFTNILDMEVFRRSLNCESSLVVVGSANDRLYIQNDIRKQLLVTQSYVDKVIIDEISNFASTCKIPKPCPEEKANTSKSKKKAKTVKFQTPVSNASSIVLSGVTNTSDANIAEIVKLEVKAEPTTPSTFIDYDMEDIDSFDFDGPKMIPSNTSSSKRKAYYRPAPVVAKVVDKPSPTATVSCITASQLVQQNPGVKRFSKPSGPNVPKPKPQVAPPPQIPTTNSAFIPNDQCFQMQRQPPTPTSVSVKNEPISPAALSKPMVFNLLTTSSGKTLNIKRETGEQIPEGPAVPTRFVLLDDNSSGSLVMDSGMQPFISHSMLPMSEIRSGSQVKRRVSAETKGVKPAAKQFRQKSLSSAPVAIITTPTVLPGGATATPFIRTTLPPSATQPSQQSQPQFASTSTSHLYRLLRPSFESSTIPSSNITAQMLPSVVEVPGPTRVLEDVTVAVPNTVAPVIKLPHITPQQLNSSIATVKTDKESIITPTNDKNTILSIKPFEGKETVSESQKEDVVEKKITEEEQPSKSDEKETEPSLEDKKKEEKLEEISGSREKLAKPYFEDEKTKDGKEKKDEKVLKILSDKEKLEEPNSHGEVLLLDKTAKLSSCEKKVLRNSQDKEKSTTKASTVDDKLTTKAVEKPVSTHEKVLRTSSDKEKASKVPEDEKLMKKSSEKEKSAKTPAQEEKTLKKSGDKDRVTKTPSNDEKSLRKCTDKEKAVKPKANEEKVPKSSEKEKPIKTHSKEDKIVKTASEKEKLTKLPVKDDKILKKSSEKEKPTKTPSTEEKSLLKKSSEREKSTKTPSTEEKSLLKKVSEKEKPTKTPSTEEKSMLKKVSEKEKPTKTPSAEEKSLLKKASEKEKSTKTSTNDEKPSKKFSEKKSMKSPTKDEKSIVKSAEKEKSKEVVSKTDKVVKKPSDKDKPTKSSVSSTAEEKPEKKPVGRPPLKRTSMKPSEETVFLESNQKESKEPKRRLTRSSLPLPPQETKTPSKPKQPSNPTPAGNNSVTKTPSQSQPTPKSQSASKTQPSSKSSLTEKEKSALSNRKRLSASSIEPLATSSPPPALRTRHKSGSGPANSSTPSNTNSNIATPRKKTRLSAQVEKDITDDSSSTSSVEEIKVVQNKSRITRRVAAERGVVDAKKVPKKKEKSSSKNSSSDEFDDDENEDEDDTSEDEEEESESSSEGNTKNREKSPPPRVTRSMGRNSASDDSDKNSEGELEKESRTPTSVNRNEIVLTTGIGENSPIVGDKSVADSLNSEGKTTKSQKRERTSGGPSEGNNSSDNEDAAEDDESENRKRMKHIHPVTPASLSVTRTRKISIPNYFAYGM